MGDALLAYKLQFIVVFRKVMQALGLASCKKLNLVKHVLALQEKTALEYEALISKYKDLFEGLGCLSGEQPIQINKQVPSIIQPCRKVPFALHDGYKVELARMEKLQVIEKIQEPTE